MSMSTPSRVSSILVGAALATGTPLSAQPGTAGAVTQADGAGDARVPSQIDSILAQGR